MFCIRLLIFLIAIILTYCVSAQDTISQKEISKEYFNHIDVNNLETIPKFFLSDTIPKGVVVKTVFIQRVCKMRDVYYLAIPTIETPVQIVVAKTVASPTTITSREPLLKITGNILYDVNYRSRIDTPYAENDVYQHTIQTRLDLLYKNQYPFRIYLTTRFSNSSLFRDYTDFNFQFSSSDFKRIVRQKLFEAAQQWLTSKTSMLDSLKHLIEAKKLAITSFNQSLQKPDLNQKIVEERERELLDKRIQQTSPASLTIEDIKGQFNISEKFSFNNKLFDSTQSNVNSEVSKYNGYKDSITTKKRKLDSLMSELKEIENLYHKLKATEQFNLAELKKQIEGAKDVTVLTEKIHQLNIPDSVLPKGYKTLYSIQSFSVGRSVADYSELSVKNVSITGVQAEFNPRYYYAVAAGKVDYRFRDYIVPNHLHSNQYVALVRFGKGTRNGNHIIFTYYTGKRQFFNSSIASQASGRIPEYNLAGMTIEGFYRINKNISFIGEIAKSTMPYYSLDSLQRKEWMRSVTKFNDRSNEAYSAKLLSYFPKTLTRFSGSLRYVGANFQSFSTFTTGASQLRWLARLEQPFFEKHLTVVSSVQQNDYNNPFVTTAYKSSSLLASFQANLRIKKWPVISLGYYPSYQLIKAGNDHYTESRYYTLMGSAGYFYKISNAQLSSYLVYSRFYNEADDSGFIYYNSKNLLLSQSVNFNRVSLMVNASFSTGTDYNIYTIENNAQFNINKIISVGGGVKMIKYSLLSAMQFGYNTDLTLKIPKLGDIQFIMDKGFIPGINRQLMENNMGRLIYYKTF